MVQSTHRLFGVVGLSVAALVGAAASSADATVVSYYASMNGAIEVPVNNSAGLGYALVDYDNVAHTLHVQAWFTGLTGTTTASHIHAATLNPLTGTAGVATTTPTFLGFPNGVTAGSFDNTLDLTLSTSYNPAFVTANGGTTATAEVALTNAIAAGRAYWNIHSTFASGGEIRGFLLPIPAPGAAALLGLGGLVLTRRRR